MSATRPVTVITGASAGIGAELARVFARHGHDLLLVARRKDRLEALKQEIAKTSAASPVLLELDVARPDAAEAIGAALAANGLEAQYLVNNAGFGLVGRAAELARAEQLAMVDLNVRALTDLSLAFVDQLARQRGGILNVASIAGFLPGPGMAVYYATKAYVLSFSTALQCELAPRGVRVTALCPGPVPTEFQARAGVKARARASALTLPADRVAAEGYAGLMQGRRLVVPGAANKVLTTLLPFVPRGLVLSLADLRQRRRAAAR